MSRTPAEPRTAAGIAFWMSNAVRGFEDKLARDISAIEAEAQARTAVPEIDAASMRVFWTVADVRGALKRLHGPVDRDESLVMSAAEAALHVLEGGTLALAATAPQEPE